MGSSLLVLIFTLEIFHIDGFCLNNVALGKPATQSSTNYGGQPERAVDGNGNAVYKAGSCSYTDSDPAYWQVDLQAEYTIVAVTITNRVDNFVWRLNNLTIEVYKTNPLADPGATPERCLSFPGAFGPVTRTLFCDSVIQGRYVRVQKNSVVYTDALTLCEFAVHTSYGDSSDSCNARLDCPADFIPHNEAYMATSGFRQFSGSLMSCVVECFWLPVCDGFNFNGTGHGVGFCELIPVSLGKPVAKSGWTFYKAVCY